MKEKANKIIAAAMAVCVVVLCIAAAVTVSRSGGEEADPPAVTQPAE